MFTQNQGEHDLTCQNRGCALTAASRTLERWGRPDWRRSSVGSSRANGRRRAPLGRKVGSFLLTAGASVAAESGTRGVCHLYQKQMRGFYGTVVFFLEPLPPEYLCAAGISVLPLPPVWHRSYRWAVTLPGCFSPGWRCSVRVSGCHSRCDKTGSPVRKC